MCSSTAAMWARSSRSTTRAVRSPHIASILKERRNYLVEEAVIYARFLAEEVNVTASDKKELFEINRNADGSTLVQIYKIDKNGNQGAKMYERLFNPLYTKEIRLYGMDGDDKFVIHGNGEKIKL